MTEQSAEASTDPQIEALAALPRESLEQALGLQLGQVILANSWDEPDAAPATRGFLKAVLSGLTPNEEPKDSPPQHFQEAVAKWPSVSHSPGLYDQAIWLSRVHERFVETEGWEIWSTEAWSASTKSIDSGKYVPALARFEDRSFLNIEEGLLVKYSIDYYGAVQLNIFGRDTEDIDTLIRKIDDYVCLPDPYEGKIVRLDDQGHAKVLELEVGELAGYSEGVEAAVSWMTSIADSEIRDQLRAANLPARAGLLLEGPPGSGKTTLTRRIAVELSGNATVVYATPDVEIDQIFTFADRYEPALIVLEDVESFFGERGESDFSAFLNELDGVNQEAGIMVLATTNDSSEFDEAVRRPGRLERKAEISDVRPGAHFEMVKARLPRESDEIIDALVGAIKQKSELHGKKVTPAVIDSLARHALMLRLTGEELKGYAEDSWEPHYEGQSYIED